MLWGVSKWGGLSFWGLGSGGAGATICATINRRVWSWTSKDPANTRKALCAWVAVQNGLFSGVLEAVKLAFDLDSATGDRLDKIGSVIDLPRRGYADDRYRLFLQIQASILLAKGDDETPRPGSGEGVLSIARTFVGPSAPPISLVITPPFAFILTIDGVTIGEAEQLADFLRAAVDAGVRGLIVFSTLAGSTWGSSSVPAVPSGTWGSSAVAVPGASTWGYVIEI